jgi:hypothetical protein
MRKKAIGLEATSAEELATRIDSWLKAYGRTDDQINIISMQYQTFVRSAICVTHSVLIIYEDE